MARKRKIRTTNKKRHAMKRRENLNFSEVFGLSFFGLAFVFGVWGVLTSPIGFYWFSALSLLMSFLAFLLHRNFKEELRSWTKYLIPAAVLCALIGLILATIIQVPV